MGPIDDFGSAQQPQAVPTGVIAALSGTHPWARFLAILGFIAVAFMLLAGLAGGVMGVASGSSEVATLMIIYPLVGLLYFFPSLYLLRFANRTRDFVVRGDTAILQSALEAQKAFYKFVGIYVVVCMILAIVAIIAFAAVGAAGVASGGALRSL